MTRGVRVETHRVWMVSDLKGGLDADERVERVETLSYESNEWLVWCEGGYGYGCGFLDLVHDQA